MPQQYYLTADPPSFIPTTWKGGWDKTDNAVDLQLDATKTTADPLKYTIQSVQSSESNVSHVYRVALARFVSGPLVAQWISGTMQIMAGVFSSDSLAELYYSLHLWATVGDSDAVRATLINQYSELAISGNPFPVTPKGRDLMASAAINAGYIEDDDRLVLEVGYIARNAIASPYTGALYYGTDYYSNGSPDMYRDN